MEDPKEEAVSLRGESGREVLTNLARLSIGEVYPEDLSPAYFIAEDGTAGVEVDTESFQALLHAGE